jgi:hypothetical protein
MTDRAVVGVYRAFDNECLTGLDARHELVVAGERILDISGLADTLRHIHSLLHECWCGSSSLI